MTETTVAVIAYGEEIGFAVFGDTRGCVCRSFELSGRGWIEED